jgi:hypothetical protein
MKPQISAVLIVLTIALVAGCTGGGGGGTSSGTNITPQGAQAGGGTTPSPGGGCSNPPGEKHIGDTAYQCLVGSSGRADKFGMSITLDRVEKGAACTKWDHKNLIKTVITVKTGDSYYMYPEFDTVLKDDLGNTYGAYDDCASDDFSPGQGTGILMKAGDTQGGALYFGPVNALAKNFSLITHPNDPTMTFTFDLSEASTATAMPSGAGQPSESQQVSGEVLDCGTAESDGNTVASADAAKWDCFNNAIKQCQPAKIRLQSGNSWSDGKITTSTGDSCTFTAYGSAGGASAPCYLPKGTPGFSSPGELSGYCLSH